MIDPNDSNKAYTKYTNHENWEMQKGETPIAKRTQHKTSSIKRHYRTKPKTQKDGLSEEESYTLHGAETYSVFILEAIKINQKVYFRSIFLLFLKKIQVLVNVNSKCFMFKESD